MSHIITPSLSGVKVGLGRVSSTPLHSTPIKEKENINANTQYCIIQSISVHPSVESRVSLMIFGLIVIMMVMDHERQRIVGKGNERDGNGNGQSTWGDEEEGGPGKRLEVSYSWRWNKWG